MHFTSCGVLIEMWSCVIQSTFAFVAICVLQETTEKRVCERGWGWALDGTTFISLPEWSQNMLGGFIKASQFTNRQHLTSTSWVAFLATHAHSKVITTGKKWNRSFKSLRLLDLYFIFEKNTLVQNNHYLLWQITWSGIKSQRYCISKVLLSFQLQSGMYVCVCVRVYRHSVYISLQFLCWFTPNSLSSYTTFFSFSQNKITVCGFHTHTRTKTHFCAHETALTLHLTLPDLT